MNRKGFTLVELLVVIAIIGILSLIIVPSVMNVNRNVNKRMLDQKIENIESGAVLYASKNDDIFNGVDEVPIKVYELIQYGYVTIDVDITDSRCAAEEVNGTKGCVMDPTASGTDAKTLNNREVILRKQGAGYTAELVYDGTGDITSSSDGTLVDVICKAFSDGTLTGKSPNGNDCYCANSSNNKVEGNPAKLYDGTAVNACIIAGENPNNYLRYGDSKPNWRVLGLYNDGGTIYAKMITSEPI